MNDDDFSKSVRFFKKVRNNPVTVMVMAVSGIVACKGLIWKTFNYVVFWVTLIAAIIFIVTLIIRFTYPRYTRSYLITGLVALLLFSAVYPFYDSSIETLATFWILIQILISDKAIEAYRNFSQEFWFYKLNDKGKQSISVMNIFGTMFYVLLYLEANNHTVSWIFRHSLKEKADQYLKCLILSACLTCIMIGIGNIVTHLWRISFCITEESEKLSKKLTEQQKEYYKRELD